MARKGKARKATVRKAPSAKDTHRAAVEGRHDQGMGRAGKAGGTKSAGGKGGRVQGGMRGGDRGGWKSGGGVLSVRKSRGSRAEQGRPP
jgi:hypothetical protein